MRISDWSSDVCSSDLNSGRHHVGRNRIQERCESGRLPCKNRTLSRSIPRSRPWIVRLRRDDGQHRRPYPPKTDVKLNMNDNEPKNQRVAKTVLTLRSEEHTSELQSLMRISYAVFCLKNKKY